MFRSVVTLSDNKTHFILGLLLISLVAGLTFISCESSGSLDPGGTSALPSINTFTAVSTVVGQGGESTILSVEVLDVEYEPLADIVVQFTAQTGSVTPTDTTDAAGVASAVYTSGSVAGSDTVTAVLSEYGEDKVIALLEISVEEKNIISISYSGESGVADGISSYEIELLYLDAASLPVANQDLVVYADIGVINGAITTDVFGRGVVSYTPPALNHDTTATLIAVPLIVVPKIGTASQSTETSVQIKQTALVEDVDFEQENINIQPKIAGIELVVIGDTLRFELSGIFLTLDILPDSLSITETNVAAVTATLRSTQFEPMLSKEILFETNFGTLSATSGITDENGQTTVQLQPAQSSGVATVTAKYLDGFSVQGLVKFYAGEQQQSNISISANPTEILADGISSSTVTVILTDSRNNPLSQAIVNFSTSFGRISTSSTTDENGIATATLFSDRSNGIAQVLSQYGDVTATTQVQFSGIQLSVETDPGHIFADLVDAADVTVTLKDAAGIPIESAEILLSVENSQFENDSSTVSGITNVNGIYSNVVRSNSNSNVTISAEGGGTITTQELALDQYKVLITAESSTIVSNTDSVKIEVFASDTQNQELVSRQVIFSSSIGSLTDVVTDTDASGMASTYFYSNIAGTAEITASLFVTEALVVSREISIEVVSASSTNLTLFADPTVITANGGQSTIRALVKDDFDNAVPGKNVIFSIPNPIGGETLSPSQALTDSTGTAITILTAGYGSSSSLNDFVVAANIQGETSSRKVYLTIGGTPYVMSTESNPPPSLDGNSFTLGITSILSDINGNHVVDGTKVYYSAQPPETAAINDTSVTVNGVATASLVYQSINAGEPITIISTSGQVKDTLYIAQLPGSVNEIVVFEIQDPDILANGSDQTIFKVRVLDALGNPVESAEVQFNSDPGSAGSAVTEKKLNEDNTQNPDWGVATFNLSSVPLENDVYPEIIFTSGGIELIYQENNLPDPDNSFLFRGITLLLEAEKETIQIGETIDIDVTLKETTNANGIEGEQVTFGARHGTIISSGVTDQFGKVTVQYTPGNEVGVDSIFATAGVESAIAITVNSYGAPDNITITADTSFIMIQGQSGLQSTYINAVVKDSEGIPVMPGTDVTFVTTLGTFASSDTTTADATTDDTGLAQVQLGSPASVGTATVTVSSGGLSAEKPEIVTFQTNTPETITISADTAATEVENSGGQLQINVAALLQDASTKPIATGSAVSFTVEDDGSGNSAHLNVTIGDNNTPATSNGFGVATTTVTYFGAQIGKNLRIRVTVNTETNWHDIILPPPAQ